MHCIGSRTLTLRILSAWRLDTRKCVNSRGRKAADRKLHAISKEIIGEPDDGSTPIG